MDLAEVLDQITAWLSEEGLPSDSSKEAQLCFLWRTLQHTKNHLCSVTKNLETNRLQHFSEMAEVRKSLEQIRIFTEQKDALAQEIQDENDQLRKQLRRIVSLQDAQISEVAKMLYQQGLTELIHSSPSEQVAYLLVERASLLETNEDPYKPTSDGNTESCLETQAVNTSTCQSTHKRAPRHLQSAWKRILGLHKTSQSKRVFFPPEATSLAGQASSLEKECSRLERDVEEGSRRLAMAHKEIRHLTDELESAHLTQRAYEPELQSAQEEVEQLRHEVEKLKKYDMVELRKAKELSDRLDLEIRALRNRVRFLDAEKTSLQQTVLSLQEEIQRLKKAEQEQQEVLTEEVQDHRDKETNTVETLQKEVERLKSALQEQEQLRVVPQQANGANESTQCREAELVLSSKTCRGDHNELTVHTQRLLEKQSEVRCLQVVENYQSDLNNLIAKICIREKHKQERKMNKRNKADSQLGEKTHSQLEFSFLTKELQTQLCQEKLVFKECPDCHKVKKSLLSSEDECETLKKEICETLKCLDKERSKNHNMKEKHKQKLWRAERKFDGETMWRDEKIKNLERKLSLCSHSLVKERELVESITVENDKLLSERRILLQQLSEEENKDESSLTASLSRCRVDHVETEKKNLENKILHMSQQTAALERSLQNIQPLQSTEERQKTSNRQQKCTPPPVYTSRLMLSEIHGLLDQTRICDMRQTGLTSSVSCCVSGALSRPAELSYLNLTSAQSLSDHLESQSALVNSEDTS